MQELIYWVIGGLLVLTTAIFILRPPPRAFGLPKNVLWTPESEAEAWLAHSGIQQDLRPMAGDDVSSADLAALILSGAKVNGKPVHGDALPAEEESDREEEIRRK